ncbi:alpha/beta hydrolase family protein [Brevundimonas sp.]
MRAALIAVVVAAAYANASAAYALPLQTPPQVGIPGCSDDVAVRASRQLISFDSRGRAIRAHLYTPRGTPNGRGIVLLHGGTGFEMNAILFDAHAIQLASRGYHVLLPAYFDAAAPDPARRTVTARAWRQAALDAVGHLELQPGIDAGQVALWGYSRGAGVAVDAVTVSESSVRKIILAAGGGSADGDFGGRAVSALVLHARSDEAVPVRATLSLADDLRGLGATVDLQALDFEGHQYDLPTWCDVMRRTRAFVDDDGRTAQDNQDNR